MVKVAAEKWPYFMHVISVGRSRQGRRGRQAVFCADYSCIHALHFSSFGLSKTQCNLCGLRLGLKHVAFEREEAVLLSSNAEMQVRVSLLLLSLASTFSTYMA